MARDRKTGLTDLQKLEQTLNDIGCEFKINHSEILTHNYNSYNFQYNATLTMYNGIGYSNFYCDFYFLDGKFQYHGCWE